MCREVFEGGDVKYGYTTIPTYPRSDPLLLALRTQIFTSLESTSSLLLPSFNKWKQVHYAAICAATMSSCVMQS